MAGRMSLNSSIIILIILSLAIKNLSEITSKDGNDSKRRNLQTRKAARDICQVKIASVSKPKERCLKASQILSSRKKGVLTIRLLNNCLAASLILLCNEVQLNSGPDQVNVAGMKGLSIIQLHVCSFA